MDPRSRRDPERSGHARPRRNAAGPWSGVLVLCLGVAVAAHAEKGSAPARYPDAGALPDARTPEAVALLNEALLDDGLDASRSIIALPKRPPPRRDARLAPETSAALAFDHARLDPLGLELSDGVLRKKPSVFAEKLDDEAVRFLDTNPHALVPDEMLEDDFVMDARRHAAERLLGRAAEAWFQDRVGLHRGKNLGTYRFSSGFSAGLALDETPTWTFKARGPGRGIRIDVPLTQSSFKFYQWRELSGEHGPSRVGASVNVNPFDEEASVAFSLSF